LQFPNRCHLLWVTILVLLRLCLCQALQKLARFQKVIVGKLCLQAFVALVGIMLEQILCVVTKMYF